MGPSKVPWWVRQEAVNGLRKEKRQGKHTVLRRTLAAVLTTDCRGQKQTQRDQSRGGLNNPTEGLWYLGRW